MIAFPPSLGTEDQARPPAVHPTIDSAGRGALALSGTWTKAHPLPGFSLLSPQTTDADHQLRIVGKEIGNWDSVLPVFLLRLAEQGERLGLRIKLEDFPDGVNKLLQLAATGNEPPEEAAPPPDNLVFHVGERMISSFKAGGNLARFTGELVLEFANLLRGRSYFRGRDFFYYVQACGADALPIVSLIAILVGIILAFVGAVQLSVFGAQIYVANLVGLAMVLEMGAMMSGVILAGRTGAAYAAQLGTMQVNEEIDALQTMGISPISFLVLPRMIALMLMLPLLCIYADLLGILGGAVVGVTMLDLSLTEYMLQTQKAIDLGQIAQGITKSLVYGVLVGYAGCLRGMQCGRSASAVGEAATSAVVTAIVLIVVADAIMNFIINLSKQ